MSQERRRRAVARLLERRRGFDRRASASPLVRALIALRDVPGVLMLLLAAINVLNVMDLALTVEALKQGNAEANPVMAALFAQGPAPAAFFKILCVAAVSLAVWRLRSYRRVLQVAVSAFALYVGVMLFHIYGHYLYL